MNFNKLVTGADQDEDLVNDGWTDIMRNLTGIAAKDCVEEARSKAHARRAWRAHGDGRLPEDGDGAPTGHKRSSMTPNVAESLKPYYRQFCKRPCFHDEYLPTFNRPNVHLVDTEGKGVDRFTETGLVANGEHYELDCIIFATGFRSRHDVHPTFRI